MKKSFLSNKWLKLAISLVSMAYVILISVLAWWTFLYEISFHNEKTFNIIYIAAGVLFLILLFYTRNVIFTRIVAMTLLLPVFLLILFNISRPIIYVVPLVVGLIMFFACSASESTKVIMGTIYILLYVVGLVAFMIASTLFGGSSVVTRINSDAPDDVKELYDMAMIDNLNAMSISPDGKYRYYIVDVKDNSRGKVIIVVEPNDLDIEYRYFTLVEAGYSSRIAIHPTRGVTPDIKWVDGSTISYTFGDGEWKTTTIRPINSENYTKNYLRFLNIGW